MPERSEDEIAGLMDQLGAHGPGGINPDHRQLRRLLTADQQVPLQFVNLLAYHQRAVYRTDTRWPDRG